MTALLTRQGPAPAAADTNLLSRAFVEANVAVYADGRHVTAYVGDPYHAVRRDAARRLLHTMLAACPPGPVLEIGAGGHTLLDRLPAARFPISADISADAVPAGGGVQLDVERPLPFGTGSLSAIVLGELIEHLVAPPAVLRELHRVLKPGGIVVLTTPNLATLQDRLRFLLGRSPRQVDCEHPYLRLHIRPFTASSLRRLLRNTGFAPAALRSNYVGWQLPTGRWLQSRSLARLLPSMGGSLVVGARRVS
ncbi:class I SAM-dependent methyltransferase [Catellatospora vulcania]|uniref:class I SAM-dependent methyltransferase n=1 Tax=Catellatospora vulcania TaxID=1460450 RepID=UPI0012D413E2|nr:class I SAM-dependent methyltransferase [Catellatospora vulcania]